MNMDIFRMFALLWLRSTLWNANTLVIKLNFIFNESCHLLAFFFSSAFNCSTLLHKFIIFIKSQSCLLLYSYLYLLWVMLTRLDKQIDPIDTIDPKVNHAFKMALFSWHFFLIRKIDFILVYELCKFSTFFFNLISYLING